MPRNGSGVYSLPGGSVISNGDTSDATDVNTPLADLVTDANDARPVVAGGTGATTASAALVNFGLTATASEINTLDGITATVSELNILDGVTATAAEINALDGITAAGSALLDDADASAQRSTLGLGTFAVENTAAYIQDQSTWSTGTGTTESTITPAKLAATIVAQAVSGFEFIASADAANDATIDFTAFDAASYDAYVFVFSNVVPATNGAEFRMRTSSDGGSTYDSASGNYEWGHVTSGIGTGADSATSSSATEISMTGGLGSAAGEDGVSGSLSIYGPHLAKKTQVHFDTFYADTANDYLLGRGGGVRKSSADVDAVRFYMDTGNIESGTITMYGMRNA